MAKKIVFQFIGEEVMRSLFFDDPEDAVIAFQNFIEDGYAIWLSEDAQNAAGDKLHVAYRRELIKGVSLVEINDKPKPDIEYADELFCQIQVLKKEKSDLADEVIKADVQRVLDISQIEDLKAQVEKQKGLAVLALNCAKRLGQTSTTIDLKYYIEKIIGDE